MILRGAGMYSWTNVLNTALPPQMLRPDTWPEHQDPVSHMAQEKRKGLKEGRKGKKGRKKERKQERRKERKTDRQKERKKERIK